jgi:hypothetical protein
MDRQRPIPKFETEDVGSEQSDSDDLAAELDAKKQASGRSQNPTMRSLWMK